MVFRGKKKIKYRKEEMVDICNAFPYTLEVSCFSLDSS